MSKFKLGFTDNVPFQWVVNPWTALNISLSHLEILEFSIQVLLTVQTDRKNHTSYFQ